MVSKSWHILGPITRFHGHLDKVAFEIAQVKFTVQATGTSEPGAETLDVLKDEVSPQRFAS